MINRDTLRQVKLRTAQPTPTWVASTLLLLAMDNVNMELQAGLSLNTYHTQCASVNASQSKITVKKQISEHSALMSLKVMNVVRFAKSTMQTLLKMPLNWVWLSQLKTTSRLLTRPLETRQGFSLMNVILGMTEIDVHSYLLKGYINSMHLSKFEIQMLKNRT